jgi:lipid A ethanolaminephosphotransferase
LWSIRLVIWTLIFVLFPLGVVAVLTIEQDPLQKHIFKKAIMSSVSFIVIATLLFCFYVDYAAIFREHRDLKGMISPQNTIASTLSYYKKKALKKNYRLLPMVKMLM